MKILNIEYRDDDTVLEAYCAYNEKIAAKKPVILIAHDWSGKNQFACNKAEQIASLGYVGFALDVFGKGIVGKTKEEKTALMKPFMEDRSKLQKRLLAAYETAKNLEPVNSDKIAAIGFCFGGLCALDLARSGADISGVVSFHGLLSAPKSMAKHKITAKVLALHGYADPMVTSDQIMQFAEEMTQNNVNWEMDIYGQAMHAFTNPEANDPDFGTVYNEQAANRSWKVMENFLKEIFVPDVEA